MRAVLCHQLNLSVCNLKHYVIVFVQAQSKEEGLLGLARAFRSCERQNRRFLHHHSQPPLHSELQQPTVCVWYENVMFCGLLILSLECSWLGSGPVWAAFKSQTFLVFFCTYRNFFTSPPQRSVLVAAVMLDTDPAATITLSRRVISVNRRKRHHMWPQWRFWEEGWLTYQRSCCGRALTLNLLKCLLSTSNGGKAGLTNHIPERRRPGFTSCRQKHASEPLTSSRHADHFLSRWCCLAFGETSNCTGSSAAALRDSLSFNWWSPGCFPRNQQLEGEAW